MSLVTNDCRISVQNFEAVPALLNLPEIRRQPGSASPESSFRGLGHIGVDLAEGCMVTKSVKYTHRLTHFINPARNTDGDPCDVEDVIDELCIMSDLFSLNHPGNLVYLEAYLHTAFDLYAFIAVTASASTLAGLTTMVKAENDRQQGHMDESGVLYDRRLNVRTHHVTIMNSAQWCFLRFTNPSFVNPKYELVALHPEHFLPGGCKLTVYDSASSTFKDYVPARDRYLRESVDPNSPRLPPFRHLDTLRCLHVNVFLVILNAQIKFRRYLDMIQLDPPANPLPSDVINLMRRTVELVDLLYWKPVPAKGSKGEQIVAARLTYQRRRAAGKRSETGSSEGMDEGEEVIEKDEDAPSNAWASSRPTKMLWPADLDLEARLAYGSAIMSGHDLDYDPALFENAFPINYTPDMYNERAAVEAWNRTVSSEK